MAAKSILSLPNQIDILNLRYMLELIPFVPGLVKNERLYRSDKLIYFVALLQSEFGFRVSEVLSIKVSDFTSDFHCLVRRKKREANVLIYIPLYRDFITALLSTEGVLFEYTTRSVVYSTYSRYGFIFKSKYSSRNSVTHSWRHMLVKSYLAVGYTYEEISIILGHENLRNTELYGVSR